MCPFSVLIRTLPEYEYAPSMVVTLCLDIRVGHQEHGENKRDDVPSRKDQAKK